MTKFKPLWAVVAVIFLVSAPHFGLAAPNERRCEFAYSVSAKEQTIYDIFYNGSKEWRSVQTFAYKIKSLSPKPQQLWIKAMASFYRKIPKFNPNHLAARDIGGRRLLDRVFSIVDPMQINLALSPKKNYLVFIQKQQQLFSSPFLGQDILEFSQFIQNDLAQLKNRDPGVTAKVILGGSFVNGKASLSESDIDLALEDRRVLHGLEDWQLKINEIIARRDPKARLKINPSTASANFYGSINSVVLEISDTAIKLLIFPPAALCQASDQLLSDKPHVYLLN